MLCSELVAGGSDGSNDVFPFSVLGTLHVSSHGVVP